MTTFILVLKSIIAIMIAFAAIGSAKDIGIEKKRTLTYGNFVGTCILSAIIIFVMFA